MSRIKQKMGYCPDCGNTDPKPIIGGFCSFHYWKSKGKTPIARKSVKISPVSNKRLDELAKYRVLREEHFKKYPTCQFPGCSSSDVTLHHAAGRVGKLLTDKKHFRSLCWFHHNYCENNPNVAKQHGLSEDRLNK